MEAMQRKGKLWVKGHPYWTELKNIARVKGIKQSTFTKRIFFEVSVPDPNPKNIYCVN